MRALFNKNAGLVAWFDGTHLFDTHLNWIGYLADGHIWRTTDNEWVGPFTGSTLRDQRGKVLLWSTAETPTSSLPPKRPQQPFKPYRPLRPIRPIRPDRPFGKSAPVGGWSILTFEHAFGLERDEGKSGDSSMAL
jgi:hypothetical protein